jgi:hypothetical protein
MITAKFKKYANGENSFIEVALNYHTCVTGYEDHFSLAYHDAKMILIGMRQSNKDAVWSITSIDLGI